MRIHNPYAVPNPDPVIPDDNQTVLRSSRRDATLVIVVWLLSCVWSVGYAALFAYRKDAFADLVWGMPRWVAVGVVAPWLVVLAVTVWYAIRGMEDVELGRDRPVPDGDPGG